MTANEAREVLGVRIVHSTVESLFPDTKLWFDCVSCLWYLVLWRGNRPVHNWKCFSLAPSVYVYMRPHTATTTIISSPLSGLPATASLARCCPVYLRPGLSLLRRSLCPGVSVSLVYLRPGVSVLCTSAQVCQSVLCGLPPGVSVSLVWPSPRCVSQSQAS